MPRFLARFGAALSSFSCLVVLLLTLESQAQAYVDPGSGAAYYQVLLIGVVGLLFRVKRMANWFRAKKNPVPSENEAR